MKKQLVLGMILSMALTQTTFAVGSGGKGMKDVQHEVKEGEKLSIEVLKGKTTLNEVSLETSKTLTSIGTTVKSSELDASLKQSIKVASKNGEKTISILEVGKGIMSVDQAVKKINRNELNDEGKAHVDALAEYVQVSTQFLALAHIPPAKSSIEVEVFNKQISLIPEISKMDTGDMKSHVEIMKKAIAMRATMGPRTEGPAVFAAALQAGRSDKEYKEKQEAIKICE